MQNVDQKRDLGCKLLNDGNEFTLRVSNVVRTDAGKYSLTAVNVAGETTASIELAVTEPTSSSTMGPSFIHAPVSVQTRLGQRVELLARFTGQPAPVCRWFKGDVGLEDGEHFKHFHLSCPFSFRFNHTWQTQFLGVGGYAIADSSDSSTLSILYLENEHVGEYLCTIRNPYGEDLATAMIMIEAVLGSIAGGIRSFALAGNFKAESKFIHLKLRVSCCLCHNLLQDGGSSIALPQRRSSRKY
ncbi:unnamed protein product [Strongylus vulgaris]|uniref:Ig-like domain-containing protein n=1 Tax=Strongylus vulgaris TaxID=40348 RepID=A0A3P7IYV4_STRVU|nr:unnamed protein product [Strongylus vulgaris]